MEELKNNESSCLHALDVLACALEERLSIIADHAFRDRDAAAHLKKLQTISEEIERCVAAIPRSEIDPHLRHYLERRSYDKALEHLKPKNGNGSW